MQTRLLLPIALLVLFFPAALFGQCLIEGQNYNEGETRGPCEVCDSSQSASEWSEPDCALQGIDEGCQVNICTPGVGCASRQLPEHTRCVDPICSSGAISQTECSVDGVCEIEREKSCGGFSCLDATSCSTQCTDDDDCLSPSTCDDSVCTAPEPTEDMGSDMSAGDMGSDMKSEDMGGDGQDMAVGSDMEKDMVISPDPVASGGGCSTTNKGSGFGLLALGFIFLIRRKKS